MKSYKLCLQINMLLILILSVIGANLLVVKLICLFHFIYEDSKIIFKNENDDD